MVGEGVIGAIINIVVLSYVARTLGPESYGMYAYVFALAALLASFGHLGLDPIAIRSLVNEPELLHGEILGTAMVLRLVAYGLAAIGLVFYGIFNPDHSHLEVSLFFAAAVFLVSQPGTTVPVLWFRAKSDMRSPSASNLFVAFVGGMLKIAVLTAGFGVLALGISQAFAGIAASGLLICVFLKKGGMRFSMWSISRNRIAAMLKNSWRFQVGGLLAALYLQIDIPLIRVFAGPEDVGEYAVAARLVAMLGIFAVAVAATVYPLMIRAHEQGRKAEDHMLRLCFSIMTLGAYFFIVAEILVGDEVLRLLIGERFEESGALVSILILTLPFAFTRPITNHWAVLNNRGNFIILSESLGALIVICLNLVLLPTLGAYGAALSMLISFTVASIFAKLFKRDTRRLLALQAISFINPVTPVLSILFKRFKN